MNLYWSATGGSILYPWEKGSGYFTEPIEVIIYEQTWNILSPGIAFYGELNRYFDIEIYIKMSPFIWLSAKDEHLLRDLVITEEIFGGFFIEPGFTFSFTPNNTIGLSLSFSYRNISGTRGNGQYEYPDKTMITDDQNGAGYSACDVSITVKFNVRNSWGLYPVESRLG
jgi:outer membrane protease